MSSIDPEALAERVTASRPSQLLSWNPEFSGDIDLRIASDGVWYHEGDPLHRSSLVKLFASILRRENDGDYYLVTPVEKWRIQVDDAPFIAVAMNVSGQGRTQLLEFTTRLDDRVIAGAEHPLKVDYPQIDAEPRPYIHLRDELWALLSRPVFVELAEHAVAHPDKDREDCYGVWSQQCFFILTPQP